MYMRIGKIQLKNSFFLLLALFILFGQSSLLPLIFLAALAHEFGHLLAIWGFGGTVRSVSISFLGAKIEYSRGRQSYIAEAVVALAGPICNLLVAYLFAQFGTLGGDALFFSGANLLLGLFNLLPISSLDGGRALYFFCAKLFGIDTAETIGEKVSTFCAAALFLFGIWVFLVSGWNLSLMLIAACLLIRPRLRFRKFERFHQNKRKQRKGKRNRDML